jgi:hypothetical protein
VDWHTITFHFEALKEEAMKYKAPSTSMFGENHDYYIGMFEDNPRKNSCMQNLKCDKNLGNMQGSKYSKSLFMGIIAFMQATKKGDAFMVYTLLV